MHFSTRLSTLLSFFALVLSGLTVLMLAPRLAQADRAPITGASQRWTAPQVSPSPTPTRQVERAFSTLRDIKAISAGQIHTCLVTQNGGVKCWGDNGLGALGDGTITTRDTPVDVEGLAGGVSAVASGYDHTCALTQAGGVKCWGYNAHGELGDGTTEDRRTPVDVSGLDGPVTAISAGQFFTCALMQNGGVKCWGFNNFRRLGDGTDTDRLTPADVVGIGNNIAAISTGDMHACALTTGGGVKCWGFSQLRGLQKSTHTYEPVDVQGLASGVKQITTGSLHSCALKDDGTVECWGMNDRGQMGDGTTETRPAPVTVPSIRGASRIAAGAFHTCALVGSGVKCWGDGNFGQLGDGAATTRSTPVDVNGLTGTVRELTAGAAHTCALMDDGTAKCWGLNASGLLGDGADTFTRVPVEVVGLQGGVAAIAAGDDTTCVVSNTGAKCWGISNSGQLPGRLNSAFGSPVDVGGLNVPVTQFAIGESHTCALTGDGTVKCWGSNLNGQLGSGSRDTRGVIVEAVNLGNGVLALTAGNSHTCAVTKAGAVKCWGNNEYGQLGDRTTDNQPPYGKDAPVDVVGLTGRIRALSAGWNHTCALTAGGTVKCWGFNNYRALGNGSDQNSNVPVDVVGLSNVIAVASGHEHNCAVTNAGAVKCWGQNTEGQLGRGDKAFAEAVVDTVGLGSGVKAIAAGRGHTCALTDSGSVKCWGSNEFGQLGDGTTTGSSTPVDVRGLTGNVLAIAAGYDHTCALLSGGGVRCWGSNRAGQLGNNKLITQAPVQVRIAGITLAPGFRPEGPLVPELTTHIPTPLDISTRPEVIGGNLLLAALLMIPFTVVSEWINRLLAESEHAISLVLRRPTQIVKQSQLRVESALAGQLKRQVWLDRIKLVGVVLFYGLIFSLLEKGWNPLSTEGVWLFLSMAIAAGLVGIADDIVQWQTVRRWGLPAQLDLRPANFLLAIASTGVSRLFAFVPGFMFGTPEAFTVDETTLDGGRKTRLMLTGGAVTFAIGFAVWLFTAVTALVQTVAAPGAILILIGGLQALLLVVFAVALQNVFLQMLALPGTFGQALRNRNRWLWGAGLIAITFLLFHSLVNPQGKLAADLSTTTLELFVLSVGLFLLIAFGLSVSIRWLRKREQAKEVGRRVPSPQAAIEISELPAATQATALTNEPAPVELLETEEGLGKREAVAAAQPVPETPASPAPHRADGGGMKRCPLCAEEIPQVAHVCEYCGTTLDAGPITAPPPAIPAHAEVAPSPLPVPPVAIPTTAEIIPSTPMPVPPLIPTPEVGVPAPVLRPSPAALFTPRKRSRVVAIVIAALVVVLAASAAAVALTTPGRAPVQVASEPSTAVPTIATLAPVVVPTLPPTTVPTIALTIPVAKPTVVPSLLPTLTRSPQPTAVPNLAGVFSKPVLDWIADKPPTFHDTFDFPSTSWYVSGDGELAVTGGKLNLTPAHGTWMCAGNDSAWMHDFAADLDVTFDQGSGADGWDVSFRGSFDDPATSCKHSVSKDMAGGLTVLSFGPNGFEAVTPPNSLSPRHLTVVAKDAYVAVLADGKPALWTDGATCPGAVFEVCAFSDASSATRPLVQFDELKIWDISGVSVPPLSQ